ncbi:helix-turn-helix domain-containing protein [Actinacidiphila sp. bgisy145]|uniref:helix-turn-helix domain-containing protein n=1 Tax=Actinacidiphila sp. bgisy145 TaxID=3413792 RepID=UPI003EBAE304
MPSIPDERQVIGDRIRHLRLHANLTQDEIVRRTGLDRRTVQRIERAETDARLSWLLAIAAALDVPLAELVADAPLPPRG